MDIAGVAKETFADLVAPEFRGTAYSMYNAFTGLALPSASLVFGYLTDRHGFQTAFLYGSFLSLLALLVFLTLRVAKRRYVTA